MFKEYVEQLNEKYNADVLIEDDEDTYVVNDDYHVEFNYNPFLHIDENGLHSYEIEMGMCTTDLEDQSSVERAIDQTEVYKLMEPK